mgnify:CR=1 FL=1
MARLKAIKEMIKNSRDEQTLDMFPDDLTKAKGAELKKTMLGQNKKKKKKRKKRVKKGEQTTMEFGAGGEIAKGVVKGIKKTKEYLKKRKKRKSFKKPDYSETKVINRTDSKDFDPGRKQEPLLPKQKEMQQKLDKLEGKDYKAGGGKVKRYAGGGDVKNGKTERKRAQQIVDEGYAKVKARREKAKRIVKGDMNPKKYAGGGKVTKPSVPKESNVRTGFRGLQFPKKSIDGIAQRGLTRAKHK